MSFLNTVFMSINQLYKLTFLHLYIIAMMFMLISVEVMFPEPAKYQNMLIVYGMMFLFFSRDTNLAAQRVFDNITKTIFIMAGFFLLVVMLPISSTNIPSMMIKSFPLAFIWYFLVVGGSETYSFVISLRQKIGIFWSSVAFALFHIGTYMFISGMSYTGIVPLLIQAFIANIAFIFIYEKTQSVFLVAYLHGLIDLKTLGLLAVYAPKLAGL